MSVLLETSAGDLVIDLLVAQAPKLCENFLKLCKVKYYNFAPIHSIQKNFSFQTGDPLGPLSPASDGGTSIWGLLAPSDRSARLFPAFFHPQLKHRARGTVSMATAPRGDEAGTRLAGSQFLVTLGDAAAGAATDHLDGKAAVFGTVVEGLDTLDRINAALVDGHGHPLVDLRIRHTVVLDDPFPDPHGLRAPAASPVPTPAQLATVRIAEGEDLAGAADAAEAEAEAQRKRARDARLQALTLEAMGDLPFAEVRPPENVLFVCKLNPVTTDEDLELIFSRFGRVLSCEVIRDRKSGDSLQYAFVEFAERQSCEEAYLKMDQVLIDDRRIHVDFSQSVSKLSEAWRSETNDKRKRAAAAARPFGRKRGGWGGVDELEKWRKYREGYDEDEDRGARYTMVHDEEEMTRTRDREDRARDRGGRGDRHGRRDADYRGGRADARRGRRRSQSPRRDGRDGRDGRDHDADADAASDRHRRDDARRRR